MNNYYKYKLLIGALFILTILIVLSNNPQWLSRRTMLRTSVLVSPYMERPSAYIDRPTDSVDDNVTPDAPATGYNYTYDYYISANQTVSSQVTPPSALPCVVGDKNYYFAGGPDSTYCKELQLLVSAKTGLQQIFTADMTPETPQARYTTALAILRIIKELDVNISDTKPSDQWYYKFNDAIMIKRASKQELTDFKTVYAAGILTGRLNPKNQSQVTLAPLDKISYIELFAMFRQAGVNSFGVRMKVKDINLPTFIVDEYRANPDWQWIGEAYSYGVEYGLISKDEFTRETLFNYATRADMVRFMARFKSAIKESTMR